MNDTRAAAGMLIYGLEWQKGLMTFEEALASAVKDIAAIREDERKRVLPRDTEEKYD